MTLLVLRLDESFLHLAERKLSIKTKKKKGIKGKLRIKEEKDGKKKDGERYENRWVNRGQNVGSSKSSSSVSRSCHVMPRS